MRPNRPDAGDDRPCGSSRAHLALTLALPRKAAAEALGVSVETFDRYIRPNVRVVYVGSVRLYPVWSLDAWLRANAQPAMMTETKRPRAARTAGGMAPGGKS